MTRHTVFGGLACSALLIGSSGLGIAQQLASAVQESVRTSCASRDLEIITMMEERGNDGSTASAKLAGAASDMMKARAFCRDGMSADGLGAYDGIAASLRD